VDRALVINFSSVLQKYSKLSATRTWSLEDVKEAKKGYMKTTDVSLRKCEILGLSALKAAESKVLASLESSS